MQRASRTVGTAFDGSTEVFKNKDVMRVVAARFISRAGGEAAFFVGIWGKAAYTFHATPGQIALLMAVLSVSRIAGTAFSGVLIDRYDPKRVLAVAEAVFVPTAIALMFAGDMWQLTGLAVLLGIVGAPVFTAAASFAPFLVDENTDLTKINAWIEGAGSTSFIIGPGIGGLMARFIGIDSVFVFDAVTSLVAVLLIWGVHIRKAERVSEEKTSAWAEMREGLRYVYAQRLLRYPVLLGTAVWIGFGAFGALEPLFYRDVLGTGPEMIGYMNTLFGLGLVIGAWLFTRLDRLKADARTLGVVSALVGLGAVMYVGTRMLAIVAIGGLVWGVFIGVSDVLLRVLIQSASPDHMIGRIAGVSQMHRQAGELLPLAVAPALAALYGVQAVLIGGGLVLTVCAALSLWEAAAVDRMPRVREVERRGMLGTGDQPVSPVP
jgi:MFS family permease